ncbi:MAG: hypothetical protein ACPG4T_21170, partial [Nannocystaceae bacterium]
MPDGELDFFFRQLEKYTKVEAKVFREKRHEKTYDRIAEVKLATLRALWTDDAKNFPNDEEASHWWEVWLRRTDGLELQRLHDFAAHVGAAVAERRLEFDDRIVTLVRASLDQLAGSLLCFGDVAELRAAKDPPSFFTSESSKDQADWVLELAKRTTLPDRDGDAPAV